MKKIFMSLLIGLLIGLLMIPIMVNAVNHSLELKNIITNGSSTVRATYWDDQVDAYVISDNLKMLSGSLLSSQNSDGSFEQMKIIENFLYNLPRVQTYIKNHTGFDAKFSVDCDYNNRTCALGLGNIYTEDTESEYQNFYIKFSNLSEVSSNYNRTIYNSLKNHENIFLLYDLSFVNLFYNWNYQKAFLSTIENHGQSGYASTFGLYNNFIKYYDDIKDYTERGAKLSYDGPNDSGFGEPPIANLKDYFYLNYTYYYDNIAYYWTTYTMYVDNVLFVSDSTSDSNIISAAKTRISNYIGNNNLGLNIVQKSDATAAQLSALNVHVNKILGTNKTYTSKIYTLTLNGHSTEIFIVKVPSSILEKNSNIKSKSYSTNVLMNTKGVDVPHDASLNVTDVTSSVQGVDKAFDINLYSEFLKGNVTRSGNGFNVSIPVASDFKATGKKIYYIDSTGARKEAYNFEVETIEGQKYVTFTTNHLSTYALADETALDNNTNNNNNTDKPKTNQKNTIKIQVPLKGEGVIKGTPNEENNQVINKYPVYVTQTVEEEIKSISLTVGNKVSEVLEITFEGTEEYNATKDGDKVTFELKEGQTGKSGKKELVGYVVVKLSKDVETPFTVTNKKVNGVKTGATLPIVSGIILVGALGIILVSRKKKINRI